MSEECVNEIITELMYQVRARYDMAVKRKQEYEGDDPIDALPLTEYQRGLVDGKIDTWAFMLKMIPEAVERIKEKI